MAADIASIQNEAVEPLDFCTRTLDWIFLIVLAGVLAHFFNHWLQGRSKNNPEEPN